MNTAIKSRDLKELRKLFYKYDEAIIYLPNHFWSDSNPVLHRKISTLINELKEVLEVCSQAELNSIIEAMPFYIRDRFKGESEPENSTDEIAIAVLTSEIRILN